jgi:trimethylamine:corrinoid methyltransferase-like protein
MGLSLTSVFKSHEIERIHEHNLDILETVGVDYKTPIALGYLKKRLSRS